MPKKPWKLPYDVVQVDWYDAHCLFGWNSYDRACQHGLGQVILVGLLLTKDDEIVLIADGVAENHEYGNVHAIPVANIAKITTLRKRG